jgi:hypothetical protein
VFVFGREVGATNQPIQIKCGTVNVRVAKPGAPDEAIDWLSAGEPVLVGCQKANEITVAVGP